MRSILITGITGTFGQAFLRRLIADDPPWERIIGFSRDEVKQADLAERFGSAIPLRLFLGDVRDKERLALAMRGVDVVVHAAALKRIDAGSYSPSEMIKTNVIGSMNVINSAVSAVVERVVVISSDKCCCPTNLYGMTKGCAESYAIHANNYGHASGTLVAAVRYGNVLGSRGSVIHRWRAQAAAGEPLTLTDPAMSRFIMTTEQAVSLVRHALALMQGGEVFVPVLPTARMVDLAEAVAPGAPIEISGLRPGGEKLAEVLLNSEEVGRTRLESEDCYVLTPGIHAWVAGDPWFGEPVDKDLVYSSDSPLLEKLTVLELRDLIAQTEAFR